MQSLGAEVPSGIRRPIPRSVDQPSDAGLLVLPEPPKPRRRFGDQVQLQWRCVRALSAAQVEHAVLDVGRVGTLRHASGVDERYGTCQRSITLANRSTDRRYPVTIQCVGDGQVDAESSHPSRRARREPDQHEVVPAGEVGDRIGVDGVCSGWRRGRAVHRPRSGLGVTGDQNRDDEKNTKPSTAPHENPINRFHRESNTIWFSNSPARSVGSRTTYLVVPTLMTTSVRAIGGVPGGVTAA